MKNDYEDERGDNKKWLKYQHKYWIHIFCKQNGSTDKIMDLEFTPSIQTTSHMSKDRTLVKQEYLATR